MIIQKAAMRACCTSDTYKRGRKLLYANQEKVCYSYLYSPVTHRISAFRGILRYSIAFYHRPILMQNSKVLLSTILARFRLYCPLNSIYLDCKQNYSTKHKMRLSQNINIEQTAIHCYIVLCTESTIIFSIALCILS